MVLGLYQSQMASAGRSADIGNDVIMFEVRSSTIRVLGELLPTIGERSQTDLYCVRKRGQDDARTLFLPTRNFHDPPPLTFLVYGPTSRT